MRSHSSCGQARASVRHFDDRTGSFGLCAHRQLASIGHRIHSVQNQIGKRSMEQVGVGGNRLKLFVQLNVADDGVASGRFETVPGTVVRLR